MCLHLPFSRLAHAHSVPDNVWYCSHFAQFDSLSILQLEQPAIAYLIRVDSRSITAVMWHKALREHQWCYSTQHHGKHLSGTQHIFLMWKYIFFWRYYCTPPWPKEDETHKEGPGGNQLATQYLKSITRKDILETFNSVFTHILIFRHHSSLTAWRVLKCVQTTA